MIFAQFLSNPIGILFLLVSIVIAVTVHEFMHAKTADMLGDPTPDLQGRVTLNPLAHLDPVGSLIFLLVGFGWGKPVQYDAYNLENPKLDAAKIAFAGPLSNIALALIASVLIHITGLNNLAAVQSPQLIPIFSSLFLEIFIYINVVLALFNLIPVAPLDGFKIVGGLLSEEQAQSWYSLERYGMIFLLLLIFPISGGRSMIELYLLPAVQFVLGFLL